MASASPTNDALRTDGAAGPTTPSASRGEAAMGAALFARPFFRRTLVSFLRPEGFLNLRATTRQLAGTLRLVCALTPLDDPAIPPMRPVWVEGDVLTIGAFPDDPRFLGWFLASGSWDVWKQAHPDETDDARFRPQVHYLIVAAADSRDMRLFEAGGAWVTEVGSDAAWQHIRSGTIPDGAIIVNRDTRWGSPIRWTPLPEIDATHEAGFARPVALFTNCNAPLPNHVVPTLTRLQANLCSDALNRDFSACPRLEHIRIGRWAMGSLAAFCPPPNLRSFVITSDTMRGTSIALARAAANTPHLVDLGTFVLNSKTRTCHVPLRIERLRLRIDTPAPLCAGRIRNKFVAPGEYFVPPNVEALFVAYHGDRATPLDFSAVPPTSALRELVVACALRDIEIAAAPLSIEMLSCPIVPQNLPDLRHLRVLTLTEDLAAVPELCRGSAAGTVAVEELTVLGPLTLLPLWPRLRVFCARRWMGKTLARADVPSTLEVLDVHCEHKFITTPEEEHSTPFCSLDALPPSLRIFHVTDDFAPQYTRIPLAAPDPCPALVVMTVGMGFLAWDTIPPSVRVLVFMYAVPPSFWDSPVAAQLTGGIVYRVHEAWGPLVERARPPVVGAPPIAASPRGAVGPHMWWRRATRTTRFAGDYAQARFGSFGRPAY